eukprot:6500526-Pyramimonas_sp.AAC.1
MPGQRQLREEEHRERGQGVQLGDYVGPHSSRAKAIVCRMDPRIDDVRDSEGRPREHHDPRPVPHDDLDQRGRGGLLQGQGLGGQHQVPQLLLLHATPQGDRVDGDPQLLGQADSLALLVHCEAARCHRAPRLTSYLRQHWVVRPLAEEASAVVVDVEPVQQLVVREARDRAAVLHAPRPVGLQVVEAVHQRRVCEEDRPAPAHGDDRAGDPQGALWRSRQRYASLLTELPERPRIHPSQHKIGVELGDILQPVEHHWHVPLEGQELLVPQDVGPEVDLRESCWRAERHPGRVLEM